MIINGIIAIIIGYLLGSIPSAYIFTRLATGKDIRQLGSGNVGGLSVTRQVGAKAGAAAAITDVGKGAGAVAIAYWVLDVPQPFVLTAALAAIVGHNWMLFLKFSGGKGAATTGGALLVLLPIYGYWPGGLICPAIFAITLIITRNIALSAFITFLFLPLIIWVGTKSHPFVIWSIAVDALMGLRFLPTAKIAWVKAENKKNFFFDRWRRW